MILWPSPLCRTGAGLAKITWVDIELPAKGRSNKISIAYLAAHVIYAPSLDLYQTYPNHIVIYPHRTLHYATRKFAVEVDSQLPSGEGRFLGRSGSLFAHSPWAPRHICPCYAKAHARTHLFHIFSVTGRHSTSTTELVEVFAQG